MSSSPNGADDLTNALLSQARIERDDLEVRIRQLHERLHAAELQADSTKRQLDHILSSRSFRALAVPRRLKHLSQPSTGTAGSGPKERRSRPAPTAPPVLLNRGHVALDVTALIDPARTGIARVIISLARALHAREPDRLRLVMLQDGRLRSADRFRAEVLGQPPSGSTERDVRAHPGSVLVSAGVATPDDSAEWFAAVAGVRAGGGTYVQILHDLLPVTMPDFFAFGMRQHFPDWLEQVVSQADLILAVSEATLMAVKQHAIRQGWTRPPMASITEGCDALPEPSSAAITALGPRTATDPLILTVGTVEPRKAYDALMDAAEEVWLRNRRVRFAVAGHRGWAPQRTLDRLRELSASRGPFQWYDGPDDATLSALYRSASLLLAPSRGEGFGLPVAEAMRAQVPTLARDLAVFRELGGRHGCYFARDADMADAILSCLTHPHDPPDSGTLPQWSDTADALLLAITGLARSGVGAAG